MPKKIFQVNFYDGRMLDIGIMRDIVLCFQGIARIIMRGVIAMSDITAVFSARKKEPARFCMVLVKNGRSPTVFKGKRRKIKRFEFVYKPSSVVYGHLSRLAVADKLKRY